MCNLDLIALTPEEEFRWWLESSFNDQKFVLTLAVFSALVLLLLSLLVLFGVMLIRYFKSKTPKETVVRDGSIPILPFLLSIVASLMFVFGVIMVLLNGFFFGVVPMGTIPQEMALWYTMVMSLFFAIFLLCAPKAGKIYRAWNSICLVLSGLYLFAELSFMLFIWLVRRY